MRQITFLMTIFMISLTGFSQELVTNGDFESAPDGSWFGNAFNIVTQGSNNLNEANVTAAGTPFSVNLSQVIDLQDGLTYELNFDAFTDANTGTRTIIAGLGQNGAPFAALTEQPTLTSTSQTFTFQFTVNYGDAVDDRVLFDMGAETGFVFIDNVSVVEVTTTCDNGVQDGDETGVDCGGSVCPPCTNPPSVAAPTPPARPGNEVISFYSDEYTQQPLNFDAGFCGPNSVEEIQVAGNNTILYKGNACQGIQLNSPVDASTFTNLHFDFYVEPGTDLLGTVISLKLNETNGPGPGDDVFTEVVLTETSSPAIVAGQWVSLDATVDLSDFDVLDEFVITAGTLSNKVYYDNLYLWGGTLSTDDFDSNQFSVYPNPTHVKWNVKASNSNIQNVEIYNTLGRLVKEVSVSSDEANIDASDLSTGIYFAKIYDTNGQFNTVKLIKK